MPRIKTYRPIDEIMEIFKITLWTVNSVIKKYKIDSFSSKGKIQINAKDFYKVYTNNFNPSLFDVWERKGIKKTVPAINNDNSNIFQKLFGSPHITNTKRKVITSSLITLKNYSS